MVGDVDSVLFEQLLECKFIKISLCVYMFVDFTPRLFQYIK